MFFFKTNSHYPLATLIACACCFLCFFILKKIDQFSLSTNLATLFCVRVFFFNIHISGGPLSALTCCINARLLSGDKKNIAVNLFSKLGRELGLYYASYDDFHPDILARMYT